MLPKGRPGRGKYARVATDDHNQDESEIDDGDRFQTVHLSSDGSDEEHFSREKSGRKRVSRGSWSSCWNPLKPSSPRKARYTFKEDLLDVHALPAKLFYFFMSFGGGFLVPFLPVYFRKLGLSAAETGFLGSLPSFITFWSAPLWTALADKFHCLRFVLVLNLVSYVVFHVSLAVIPSALSPGTCLQEDDKCVRGTSSVSPSPVSLSPTTYMPANQSSSLPYSESSIIAMYNTSFAAYSPSVSSYFTAMVNATATVSQSGIDSKKQIRDVVEAAAFVALAHIFSAAMHSTADAAVIQLVDGNQKTGESRYGKQRLWGAAGFALGNIVSGLWASMEGDKCNNGRYSVHFAGFAIFMVLSACVGGLCLFPKPSSKQDGQGSSKAMSSHQPVHVTGGLKMIFSRPRTAAVFLAVFALAIAKGIDSFLVWFLKEMCASEAVLGWSLFMLAGSEVPMFLLSDKIVARLGHVQTIYAAFALFVVRTALYTTLTSPYFVLPLETLRGAAFSLLWSCAVQYGRRIAAPGLEATMQGILSGIWYGVGSGLGSIAGGAIYQHAGPRVLFGLSSVWCLVTGCLFALSQVIIERRERTKRSEAEENVFLADEDDVVEFDQTRANGRRTAEVPDQPTSSVLVSKERTQNGTDVDNGHVANGAASREFTECADIDL